MEDQLEQLNPRPSLSSLIVGSFLILWIIFRTSIILHWDGILFALVPITGIALSMIYQPYQQTLRFRDPILCLMLLPAFPLIMRLFPEEPISLLTARISGIWLGSLGLDVLVKGRSVLLEGGGVEVLGPCNGLDMMAQVFCVAIIFLLAFPIKSGFARILLLVAAPIIGLVLNTIRISLLTLIVASGNGKGSFYFDFFHEDGGSLIFSGISVFLFGILFMRLLDRELQPVSNESHSTTTGKDLDI
jgi:cyanoexosortase A